MRDVQGSGVDHNDFPIQFPGIVRNFVYRKYKNVPIPPPFGRGEQVAAFIAFISLCRRVRI